jgi:hypothetical protein
MTQIFQIYGPWGEHPRYSISDWKAEVANDDTRLGYWAWVAAQSEAETMQLPDRLN